MCYNLNIVTLFNLLCLLTLKYIEQDRKTTKRTGRCSILARFLFCIMTSYTESVATQSANFSQWQLAALHQNKPEVCKDVCVKKLTGNFRLQKSSALNHFCRTSPQPKEVGLTVVTHVYIKCICFFYYKNASLTTSKMSVGDTFSRYQNVFLCIALPGCAAGKLTYLTS